MQAFFSAITHAQHHIYISSPYFLPNEAILTAIKVASLSGIDVRIMIPSRSDSKIVYWASRSYIEELIDANVKVYLYRRGFNHSKLIMIDENSAPSERPTWISGVSKTILRFRPFSTTKA